MRRWLLIWTSVDAFLFDPNKISAAGSDWYTFELPLYGVQNTRTGLTALLSSEGGVVNTEETCAVSDARFVTVGTYSVALHISDRDATDPRAHCNNATIQVLVMANTARSGHRL